MSNVHSLESFETQYFLLPSANLLKVDVLRATDDQMIKVVFFLPHLLPRGPELVAAALIRALSHFLQLLDLQFDNFFARSSGRIPEITQWRLQ